MQLWDVESSLPYTMKGQFVRDHDGQSVWVVCLKTGWQLVGGQWQPLNTQPEIYSTPAFAGEPGFSALLADQDFVVTKTNTDVLVNGHARSYGKKPVTKMNCRLLIEGHIDKTVQVLGARQWITQAGQVGVTVPSPFIEQPVSYAQAMGGEDERNRAGCGIALKTEDLLTQNVPSVFYPDQDWKLEASKVRPASFGPVAVFDQPRAGLAGTFDEVWEEERRPLYPVDFNPAFYQSAPADQQTKGLLAGGERLIVSGFSHEETLYFTVPRRRFVAQAIFADNKEKQPMSLHTLSVDADTLVVTAVWSAAFPCQGRVAQLNNTVISEEKATV
ncbi:DUF2169 domain-containing protein [Photobacterium galatheae]|uniref:DUF2169 domain-containing protein n=1 Tax=Photobacterium galatheae TaxID=1654360 RepID=A0A066RUP2_9GAMM|nr:DUF2169 domain-containing protein [Photobacterium galatheae]KDM91098.1 hypothetical protein EA58_13170 [Photobacterium galatheae]MCM0150182.1 DUF2169 domain-containing protein [Photobacterium galatheae]